ncbi:MAG: PepSY domain-containing protein [Alphaproteobacteria bacterium]|nr:PepSY domain-containing protein [Alphaproteobacteria bacterium]MBU0799220.1 PepSY domain-containing protein [Alphaproteobacteria bacterium]MBU0887529.1 PepSY domain-containing protein [Alphaproteobacteria bacterium]MBU1814766.1 PepSY domain-containing protein [Alphaproteobacteria bacterium]
MRIRVTALAAAALICVIALPALASDRCTVPKNEWQTSEQLQSRLEAQGWKIQRIKTDDGCYEVYATDSTGKRVEAYFNPKTLEMIRSEQKG